MIIKFKALFQFVKTSRLGETLQTCIYAANAKYVTVIIRQTYNHVCKKCNQSNKFCELFPLQGCQDFTQKLFTSLNCVTYDLASTNLSDSSMNVHSYSITSSTNPFSIFSGSKPFIIICNVQS